MKVLDVIWFTEMGAMDCIGIVKCKNDFDEIKWYIGKGISGGSDEALDARSIMLHGSKFHPTLMAPFLHLSCED